MLPAEVFDLDFLPHDDFEVAHVPANSTFLRFSSRLPVAEDGHLSAEDRDGHSANADHTGNGNPWDITQSQYEKLYLALQSRVDILPPGSVLPSRNICSRNLESFFRCGQDQLPFVHPSSFSIQNRGIGLILAAVAVGALFRFEHSQAFELYDMAKAMAKERTIRDNLEISSELLSESSDSCPSTTEDLDTIQSYVLLVNFTSWTGAKFLPEALTMGYQLSRLVKRSAISEPDRLPDDISWATWIAVEEKRRTLFAAYAVLNLQSIAYDTTPSILNHEVGLFVPGTAACWKATNKTQWREAFRPDNFSFLELLNSLYDGVKHGQNLSSFADYVLVHGILQQICLEREQTAGILRPDRIRCFEDALKIWQLSWERNLESSLDPLSNKGPLALKGASIFRIAYMRLLPDFRPHRGFFSEGVQHETPKGRALMRSPCLTRAVLQAAHALSIPVRLGVELIARTYLPFWSIEHSLSSFECALLLDGWLRSLTQLVKRGGMSALNDGEKWVLSILTDIVNETSFARTLAGVEDDLSQLEQLPKTVAQLWTRIFAGAHVYEIDNVIQERFSQLANLNPG